MHEGVTYNRFGINWTTQIPEESQKLVVTNSRKKRAYPTGFRPRLYGVAACVILILVSAELEYVCAQSVSPQSLYDEAGRALDSGNAELAIQLYKELLRKVPGSVEARTNLGVALAHEGRYSEAVVEYREVLKRGPENQVVLLNLALALYKQGDFEEAGAELERLHSLNSANQQAFFLLADCYLRLGRYHDAVVLLLPAYEVHPEDPATDYALGTALIQDGQLRKGAEVIDHILKNGSSPTAMLLVGISQYAAGDYKKAEVTLHDALQANPNLPGGWTIYGRDLLSSGDNEKAKSAFRRALDADPNDFDANLHLGGMLRHDGDNDAAAPYVSRALRLRPESPAAQFQVGALNLAMGHLEEARKELEAVAKRWPDFLEAHVQLATLYARTNRPLDSERERKIVLTLNEKARRDGPQPAQEP